MRRALLVVLVAATGCSGASGSVATRGSTPPAGPDLKAVHEWPTRWCQARPGASPTDLIALMGAPTSDLRHDSSAPQMSWDYAEYQFNAFLGVDGRIRQLDINTIHLSVSEKASLGCAVTRVS